MEFFEFTSIAMRFGMVLDSAKSVNSAQPPTYLDYLWVYLLVGGLCFAVVYVFQAIALYTIGKREGFKHRWMAFVPILNTYYMGVVSEKNRAFGVKAKYVSLVAAIAEAVCLALYVLYYVAVIMLLKGNYIAPQLTTEVYGGIEYESWRYAVHGLPEYMTWVAWIYNYLEYYVLTWFELLFIIANVFVLVSFFRTYATPNYIVFTILSVLFPVKGIIMFAVRKRRGMNYTDYLREQRQRQYAAYQEYMRANGQNNGGYGNGYNNGYGGQGNPYSQQQPQQAPPEDPFEGLGSGGGNSGAGDGENN